MDINLFNENLKELFLLTLINSKASKTKKQKNVFPYLHTDLCSKKEGEEEEEEEEEEKEKNKLVKKPKRKKKEKRTPPPSSFYSSYSSSSSSLHISDISPTR